MVANWCIAPLPILEWCKTNAAAAVELCAPLPIAFQNYNLWASRRWEGSHRTGCGRNSLKISTPLPLKRTFWITKLLSKSILIDSTFKDEVTFERLVVRRTLYTLLRALYTWRLVLHNFVVRQKIRHYGSTTQICKFTTQAGYTTMPIYT